MSPAAPLLRIVVPDEVPHGDLIAVDPVALGQAREIMQDVQTGGEAGLLKHAHRLGDLPAGVDTYFIGKEELKVAFEGLPQEQKDLLDRTAKRILAFATSQKASFHAMEVDIPGGRAGHDVSPVAVAGCYAPGGRYPLPSSVLMTAVTARAAGVETVIVASPRPSPVTLGAAHVAGADALLCVGGAQAVAALAYGAGSVPACDVIVGPGNKWVTAAKSLVAGRCGIDMLAGPSEVLAIADETADADVIAADMLAQAEHDTEARPILVSTDRALIDRVNDCMRARLDVLPTKETAEPACSKGFAVLCGDMDEAIRVADAIAPEHLEVQTSDSKAVASRLRNYGGLFVGEGAAEVLGDYGAGPNHVLPTGGTAKYTGGLSVLNFLRVRTWMRIDDRAASQEVVRDSVALARLEGLEGHARSAECRLAGESAAKKQRTVGQNGTA
jgi:histidinol dehydrogenase